MTDKIVDTSDLLTEEDELLLLQIENIKRNIIKYINPQTVVDKMKEIIENSEHFDFKSKRNAKYISLEKPLFIISIDRTKVESKGLYKFKYKGDDSNKSEVVQDCNFINNLISLEITSKFTDFIVELLKDNEGLLKIINEKDLLNGKQITTEQLQFITYVTASIFGITIGLKENTIYLEYVV